jgi:hypothetical protein
LTATSADGCCTKRRFVAAVGSGGGLVGVAKGVAEEVYCVALEAESDVGVHGGGDTDVGVAEEFLDDDEFDALFQEEGGRRVAEVVEADAAEPGPAETGNGLQWIANADKYGDYIVGKWKGDTGYFIPNSRLRGVG